MVYHKKCPPGVICVENITMGFIIIIVCIVIYLFYSSLFKQMNSHNNNNNNNNNTREKIIIKERERNNQANGNGGIFSYFTRPNYAYNNLPHDVLMNPYAPPLNDER